MPRIKHKHSYVALGMNPKRHNATCACGAVVSVPPNRPFEVMFPRKEVHWVGRP
jgi:hypothetical protein